MSTVMPQSELVRKAVKFIAEQQADAPDRPLYALVEDAAVRFNLSPVDAEFLMKFFKEKKD
ncbi:MAG: hypothetical protein AB7E47_15070 [Desulfovibrionaceae bacterium]